MGDPEPRPGESAASLLVEADPNVAMSVTLGSRAVVRMLRHGRWSHVPSDHLQVVLTGV